jgi:hypothetical protein
MSATIKVNKTEKRMKLKGTATLQEHLEFEFKPERYYPTEPLVITIYDTNKSSFDAIAVTKIDLSFLISPSESTGGTVNAEKKRKIFRQQLLNSMRDNSVWTNFSGK